MAPRQTATGRAKALAGGQAQMYDRSLNLLVGTPLGLFPAGEEFDEGFAVELIGYLPEGSVLVTMPLHRGVPVVVEPGDHFVVRVAQGDARYAFEAQVLSVAHVPYPHVHLTYPEGVEGMMLRRGNRVSAHHAELHLTLDEGGRRLRVTMVDVSVSGGCLVAREPLGDVDDRFSIEMQIAADAPAIELPCVIRHVRDRIGEGRPQYLHGVAFRDLDARARGFLERFVRDAIVDQRAG
jgi:c-di-GMP-binding flagellar brake protein YcgR